MAEFYLDCFYKAGELSGHIEPCPLCGRQSYMPSLVIGEVRKMIPMLNDKTIGCMERDIREAEKFGGYGDEKIDKPGWLAFLKELQNLMDKRGIERWQ